MFRFLGRLIRGAATAAIIVAVIVGTPWLLLHFFGPPIPTSMPSLDTVREWFETPNTSEHLGAVVLLVVWAGWAIFTYIIAVEVVAAIRGVRAPRVKLATPLHSMAAGLVGATATALSSAAAHAAPPAPAPVHPAATMPDPTSASTPTSSGPIHAEHPAPHVQAPAPLRYEVAPGDHLSGIATRFLADPDAYPRIQAANPDIELRDPRFPDHIEPGWTLVLPVDAFDRGPTDHATGLVLHPPNEGPDAERPRPDEKPPADDHPPAPPEPATPDPTTTPSAPDDRPQPSVYPQPDDDDIDRDHNQGGETPVVYGGSRNGLLAGAAIVSTLALQVLEANRRRQRSHRRTGQQLPNPRDGATERDLRVAEAPADVQRLDVALRHLTASLADHPAPPDIAGVRLIGGDVHLLHTGGAPPPPDLWLDEGDHWLLPATTPVPDLPVTERPVPTLTAVGSRAGRHLMIDLERHGSFTITGHPERALALLRYIVCELAINAWSEDVEVVVAGFPDTETALFKEVRTNRVVTASSVTDAAAQLHRRITATRRALDALELPDTLHGRLRGIAVDAWTPHVLLVHNPDPHDLAILDKLHQDLAAAGRSGGAIVVATPSPGQVGDTVATVTADGTLTLTTPHLRATTAAAGLPIHELERIAEILRLALVTDLPTYDDADTWPQPTAPVATSPAPPDPDQLVRNLYDPQQWATATDDARVQPPSPQDISAAPTTNQTATRITVAGDDPTLDIDLATWRSDDANPPRIAILGRIDVTATGPAPERRRGLHNEIAVYLAAHPRGASHDQLIDAVWPNGVNTSTARGFFAAVRRWLGNTTDGRPWLPDARDSESLYRIERGYLLDWHLLQRLRARARRRGRSGADDLRAALTLVRGRPFTGADNPSYGRNQYTWLSESMVNPLHILAVITDTAHHLAQHCLDEGDTAGARWAVTQAWIADPDRIDDEPWLVLMRAAQMDGNRAELRQLRDQLVRYRGHEVPEELPPPTFNTIEELLRQ